MLMYFCFVFNLTLYFESVHNLYCMFGWMDGWPSRNIEIKAETEGFRMNYIK
jgi:hypothetical protein